MVESNREEVSFTGRRVRQNSKLSFDDVLARLRAQVGETTVDHMVGLSGSREDFEKQVQQYVGKSGFMLMAECGSQSVD